MKSGKLGYWSQSKQAIVDPEEMPAEYLLNAVNVLLRKVAANTATDDDRKVLNVMVEIADRKGFGTAKPPVEGQYVSPHGHGGF
jgi:hypothetical protein